MYDVKNNWPCVSNDLVDRKYFPPPRKDLSFVFPLGPLVHGAWKENVGHPRISRHAADLLKANEAQPPDSASADDDSFDRDNDKAAALQRRQGNSAANQDAKMPDILFMRYIDYDVQPGKNYRYRIKLVLRNPNWNVPEKYLLHAGSAKTPFMDTSWSKPSPTVTVPPAATIEPRAVNAPRSYVLVNIKNFDMPTGEYQSCAFKVERGQTMNFYDHDYDPPVDLPAPRDDDFSMLFSSPRKPVAPQKIDFVTDLTLIDCHERNHLPGRHHLSGLASVLIMDAAGNLHVLEENEPRKEAQLDISGEQIAAAMKSSRSN